MSGRTATTLIVVALVAAAILPPVTGLADSATPAAADQHNEPVTVGAGEQLSTVLHAESESVHGQVRTRVFAAQFESASGEQAVRLVNDRIDRQYRRARRLAVASDQTADRSTPDRTRRYVSLAVRARATDRQLAALQRRIETAPESKLDASAVETARLDEARQLLDRLVGPGPRELLDRFRGRSAQNVSVSFDDGLRISVTGEEDGQLRTIRRSGDDRRTVEIDQAAAQQAALDAVASEPGTWEVTSTTVRTRLGVYRVELVQTEGPDNAVATVDASSEQVVRLVLRDAPSESTALRVTVRRGDLAPGETALVRVAAPPTGAVADATLSAAGESLGTTGRLGLTRVTIPADATVLVVTADERTRRIDLDA